VEQVKPKEQMLYSEEAFAVRKRNAERKTASVVISDV